MPPAASGRSSHGDAARWRVLNNSLSTEALFEGLFGDSYEAFLLHSASIRPGLSRYSFMGSAETAGNSAIYYQSHLNKLRIANEDGVATRRQGLFSYLESEIQRFQLPDSSLPFDFCGGFVGYFGYELKRECGASGVHRSELPDAAFILAKRFVAIDHENGCIYLVCVPAIDRQDADAWFDEMERRVGELPELAPVRDLGNSQSVVFTPALDKASYLGHVRCALERIAAGDTYQVCLTNRLVADTSIDPWQLYRALAEVNPAPFSAFLRFESFTLVSASPERFLQVDRHRRIQAKPIKGTSRRGREPPDDAQLAETLRNDPKNRAENVMIVDLLRNDLSRVSETGSVRVARLFDIETYPTVHHLVSTIESTLLPACSAIDAIRAAFPGGSMTGAPKIKAMEILDELEGRARGPYSGALGYLGFNSTTDLSIVIRTIVATKDRLSIGVGGAIVADSDPDQELEESLLKAKALLRAVNHLGFNTEVRLDAP